MRQYFKEKPQPVAKIEAAPQPQAAPAVTAN
jgi:hypothetical protein